MACEAQEEIDGFWEKLSAGGEPGECGWRKDRYGVSWQIVPSVIGGMMSDPDPGKSERVIQAVLQRKKIDIAGWKRASVQK